MVDNVDDGIRYHDKKQILDLDRRIKSYLELENIKHFDLSDIPLNKRSDFVIKTII
jgi:hypothetical protein